jgi:REP element-mobilizing transposase RayT
MSRKYKFADPDKLYFITYSVVYWIDLFIRNEYRDIIVNSWKYCQQKKGLEIYGWVIMTNHVHMIIGTRERKLEDIVRDMKSATSTQLRAAIANHPAEGRKEWMLSLLGSAGKANSKDGWQLWQQHNKPIMINNAETFYRVLDYIHNNPVKAGFVLRPEDWLFSSAGDFHGRKGPIEISYIN